MRKNSCVPLVILSEAEWAQGPGDGSSPRPIAFAKLRLRLRPGTADCVGCSHTLSDNPDGDTQIQVAIRLPAAVAASEARLIRQGLVFSIACHAKPLGHNIAQMLFVQIAAGEH
jgi:hypothetical protein